MEERFTIKQVLIITRDLLKGIGNIPIDESEHIGVPVINAIQNLDACINAIEADEARKAETQEAGEVNAS